MTDDLRQTMQSLAGHDPGAGDAWTRFQGRKRRNNALRTIIALGAGAAAFAVLFLVLPGVSPGTGDAPVNIGSSVAAPQPRQLKLYIDARGGFQLQFPAEWVGRGLSGRYGEFFPRDGGMDENSVLLSSVGGGGEPVVATPRTFYVRVHVRNAGDTSELTDRSEYPRLSAAGARVPGSSIEGPSIDPRASEVTIVYPRAPRASSFGVPKFWCTGCIGREIALPRARSVLEVEIVAPDQITAAKFDALALAIMRSIEAYTAPNATTSPDRL